MNKSLRASALLALLAMLVLTACGDSTATNVPATTTAAAATTTSAAATTTASATTTAAAATTTSAVAGGNGAGGTIRIYSSLPDTGSSKGQIDTLINAMKLAVDTVTGGTSMVAGFKIDYVALDDATAAAGKWDAGQEAANANKAANDPEAMVYIGTFNSGAAKVAMPIINKASMVMVSPANTYPGLTHAVAGITGEGEPDKYYPTGLRNYFRIEADDDLEGPADANFIANTLKAKTLYIVDNWKITALVWQRPPKSRQLN